MNIFLYQLIYLDFESSKIKQKQTKKRSRLERKSNELEAGRETFDAIF